MKCTIKECKNHSHQVKFINGLCLDCNDFVASGGVGKLRQQLTEAKEKNDNWENAMKIARRDIDRHVYRAEKAEARAELYDELLYQVVNKVPDESRHDTAKRIIFEHENRYSSEPEQALKESRDDT